MDIFTIPGKYQLMVIPRYLWILPHVMVIFENISILCVNVSKNARDNVGIIMQHFQIVGMLEYGQFFSFDDFVHHRTVIFDSLVAYFTQNLGKFFPEEQRYLQGVIYKLLDFCIHAFYNLDIQINEVLEVGRINILQQAISRFRRSCLPYFSTRKYQFLSCIVGRQFDENNLNHFYICIIVVFMTYIYLLSGFIFSLINFHSKWCALRIVIII